MPIHHRLLGKNPTYTDRFSKYLVDEELGAYART
jgi:hypothetical protein